MSHTRSTLTSQGTLQPTDWYDWTSFGTKPQARNASRSLRGRFINFAVFRPYRKIRNAVKEINAKIDGEAETYNNPTQVNARTQSKPIHLEARGPLPRVTESVVPREPEEHVPRLQQAPTQRSIPRKAVPTRTTLAQHRQSQFENTCPAQELSARSLAQSGGNHNTANFVGSQARPRPLAYHPIEKPRPVSHSKSGLQIGQPQLIATTNPRITIEQPRSSASTNPRITVGPPQLIATTNSLISIEQPQPTATANSRLGIGPPQLIASTNPQISITRKPVAGKPRLPPLGSIPEDPRLAAAERAQAPVNAFPDLLTLKTDPLATTRNDLRDRAFYEITPNTPREAESWDEAYRRKSSSSDDEAPGLKYQPYTGGFRDSCQDTDFAPAPSEGPRARILQKRDSTGAVKYYFAEPDWDQEVDVDRVKKHYSSLKDCDDEILATAGPMYPNLEARERAKSLPEVDTSPEVSPAATQLDCDEKVHSPLHAPQHSRSQSAHGLLLPDDTSCPTANFSKPIRVPSPGPLPWYSPWPSPVPGKKEYSACTPRPVQPGYYRSGTPIDDYTPFNPLRRPWTRHVDNDNCFLYKREEWEVLSKKNRLKTRLWWYGLQVMWCFVGGYPKLWQSA